MANPTRPKRAGDDFLRTHDPPTKKPRFDARNPSTLAADAPEEDVILDADVIGKGGRQIKRNAVNIDGYESDSDNDNFNARAAERERATKANGKAGPGKSQDEEEDDMFADLEEHFQGTVSGDEDEDVAREGKGMKKKKDVRFLDQGEIEGQVMNSTSGGHVSSDILLKKGKQRRARANSEERSDSSSGEDDDRDLPPSEIDPDLAAEVGAGAKKKHAPRLDAFNLRDEEEEGRFDESGNFVRKAADPDAVNDVWLDGLSKKDMKRAREAQEKRDEEQRRKTAESDALLSSDLLGTLIMHLETGETALEALQRLNKGKAGGGRERKMPKWKLKKIRNGMDVDDHAPADIADPVEAARRKALEAITGAADALYTRENHEIYDTERELLMRQYKRETGDDWQPPPPPPTSSMTEPASDGAAQSMWEYRWSDARDGEEHHGPYDAATMRAWNDAGYFGEGVEFRKIGGAEWDRVLEVPLS